ncbi:MAG: Asp-tRNA(Asn)/Glu-tRNA(Gln) amidotransferase subunit GatC [Pseudomonadota bacterium]
MTLTPEIVKKIARLAQLKVNDNDIDPLCQDLSHILDWVAQLDEINAKDVEPMTSVNLESMPMRQDAVNDGQVADAILKNAPDAQSNMFVVPRVVE